MAAIEDGDGEEVEEAEVERDEAEPEEGNLFRSQEETVILGGADKVLIDTAGRLHTKTDFMHELAKIRRVCEKVLPGSPHETLLVLDATTGQNVIEQVKVFHQFTPITGVILTKLDGTAKGGVIFSIQRQLGVPVKFIGTGEGADDLQPFNPEQFVQALF